MNLEMTDGTCTDSDLANMLHMRQSRPDSGLDFQGKVLTNSKVFLLR